MEQRIRGLSSCSSGERAEGSGRSNDALVERAPRNAIAQHEQIAAEIERASEPDGMRCRHKTKPPRFRAKPRPIIRGLHQIPIWDNRGSGLSAGDYSSPGLHWTTFDLWLMLMGSPQAQSLSQLTGMRLPRSENSGITRPM